MGNATRFNAFAAHSQSGEDKKVLTALYPIQGGKADVHQLESFRPIDFNFLSPSNGKANSSKVWQDIERATALEKEKQEEQEQPKGSGKTSHRTHDSKRIGKPQDKDHKRPHHTDYAHQIPPHASDHAPHKPPHPTAQDNDRKKTNAVSSSY